MGFFDVLLGNGIDGIETVKRIHQMDPKMYAILVTAYQDRHVNSIQKVFGRDFEDRWDYLNKPSLKGRFCKRPAIWFRCETSAVKKSSNRREIDEMKLKFNENEKLLTIAAVARSVGHEFGNILLQIMGRADLSRGGAAPEMKSALDTILTATEHASQVLDRFKSLARPAEVKHHFEKLSLN